MWKKQEQQQIAQTWAHVTHFLSPHYIVIYHTFWPNAKHTNLLISFSAGDSSTGNLYYYFVIWCDKPHVMIFSTIVEWPSKNKRKKQKCETGWLPPTQTHNSNKHKPHFFAVGGAQHSAIHHRRLAGLSVSIARTNSVHLFCFVSCVVFCFCEVCCCVLCGCVRTHMWLAVPRDLCQNTTHLCLSCSSTSHMHKQHAQTTLFHSLLSCLTLILLHSLKHTDATLSLITPRRPQTILSLHQEMEEMAEEQEMMMTRPSGCLFASSSAFCVVLSRGLC